MILRSKIIDLWIVDPMSYVDFEIKKKVLGAKCVFHLVEPNCAKRTKNSYSESSCLFLLYSF